MAENEGKQQISASEDALEFPEGYDMSVFNIQTEPLEGDGEGEGGAPEGGTASTEQNKETGDPANEGSEESVASGSNEKDEGGEGSSSPGIYSSLADVLIEQGILSPLESDSKIENANDLVDHFQNEVRKREYSDLNENQRKYLEGLRHGIPEEQVEEHIAVTDQLNTITEDMLSADTSKDLRITLMVEDFTRKGFTPERAKQLADRSVETGNDIEDAKVALDSVRQHEAAKYQQAIEDEKARVKANAEAFQKSLTDLKGKISETKEIIPGVKMSNGHKDALYAQMTKPVARTQSGQPVSAVQKARIENPMDFDIKLNYLFQLTKGFTDFSKLTTNATTKAVNKLDQALHQSQQSPGGSGAVDSDITDAGAWAGGQLGEIADF